MPLKWRQNLKALQWRLDSIWSVSRGIQAFGLYRRFRDDLRQYQSLPGAGRIYAVDFWPCLFDRTETSEVPPHYFYQAAWAARKIVQTHPHIHVDVGSQLDLIATLSASIPLIFLDIRPLISPLSNLQSISGSILSLPFVNDSIRSLSCLHVIEHIGLGRYGDPLDPEGTKKAAAELSRVLAKGGNLFLSVPIGRERVCFNAHRIHDPETILRYFDKLDLLEFSCEDSGSFHENADPKDFKHASYSCGMFWFTKR